MLTFPRSVARRLRTLARKCVVGRPRGPAPPVWIVPTARGCRMQVSIEDISVSFRIPGVSRSDAPVMIPMEALEVVDGAGDESVQVEQEQSQVTLVWADRGLPRSQSFARLEAGELTARWAMPKSMTAVPARFAQALHHAGQTAARESHRYALDCVQVRGAAGEVIGTDAHFVVRFEGFTLPFEDEILVPAVPLFGLDEFAKAGELRLGLTRRDLIVVVDDITIRLRHDRGGRYPDVDGVFPTDPKPATVTLQAADALFLLDALPALPCRDESHRPITLDLAEGEGLKVRATSRDARDVVEVHLPRSTVSIGTRSLAIDIRYLIRLLTLGCWTFRVFDHQKPMIAAGDAVTTLVMPLETELVVPPAKAARVLTPDNLSEPITPRSRPMKSVDPSANGHAEVEALDPLAEAEALRNALTETLQRLSRLVTALRSRKKEQRALTQVWSSLKSLQLGN